MSTKSKIILTGIVVVTAIVSGGAYLYFSYYQQSTGQSAVTGADINYQAGGLPARIALADKNELWLVERDSALCQIVGFSQ